MDALGVQAPSLLGGPQDEKLSRETMEEVENTRRKLGSITMDKCKPPSLSETTLTTQASWNPREIDETTGEKAQQGEGDSQSFRPMSLKPGAVSRAVQQASTIPLISAVALPGINTIMQNLGALESVQSFHSAVSHQENPFENDQDAIRGLQSAESQAIPSNYLAAEGPSPTSAAMGTPHSIHGATVPVPVWPSQDASSKAYSASQDAYEEDVTLNSDCYRSWQKDVAEASARHFNMDPKDAESLACLIQMPRIKTAQVTYVDPATQWSPCIGPIRYLQSLSGQREHGGRTNSDEPQTNGPRISYPSGEMYIQGAQGAESISSAEGRHPTHRHSKHRSEALPILRPTRTHRKERIVIVDSPPTPRTPQATSPGPEMQILNGQPSHPLQQTQSGQHRESLSSPSMYFHRWQPPKTQSSTGSVNQPPPGMRYGRQGTPETGLESPGMRVVLSNYVTETGPSAITSAMRPPHSIHGHINPVPEWAPQGLGLNPRIVTYDNYGPGTECTYQAQGMDDFASEFTAPRPNGFVGECQTISSLHLVGPFR